MNVTFKNGAPKFYTRNRNEFKVGNLGNGKFHYDLRPEWTNQ